MINILILEDNQYKRETLIKFLKEFFVNVNIDFEETFQKGIRKALRKEEDENNIDLYDFIFLDDAMPRFSDAMWNIETGMAEHALNYLYLRNIPTKCIISSMTEGNKSKIAQFDEMGKEFEGLYIGQIDLNPASLDWHKQLTKIFSNYPIFKKGDVITNRNGKISNHLVTEVDESKKKYLLEGDKVLFFTNQGDYYLNINFKNEEKSE